jgi:hypothetical protein
MQTHPARDINMVAKLADFGLSKVLDPAQTHLSNYRSGTPFYVGLAPRSLAPRYHTLGLPGQGFDKW